MTAETDKQFVERVALVFEHEGYVADIDWPILFALARRGAAVEDHGQDAKPSEELKQLRATMTLKINEKQFLAAVDREGDYECGAGKFTDDKRAHSAFTNSENARKGEQRTICEACGNTNLAHDRAAWADDGASYCQKCFRIIVAGLLPPPPTGEKE